MSLRHLRTLVAIERYGSFVAAAEQLGLTQSAVSQQMRALESDMGVQLFDRYGRSPRLNTDGREACLRAEQVLQQYSALGQGLGSSSDQSGTLAIGATYTVQTGPLAPVLAQLRRAVPHVFLRVYRGMSADLTQRVEQGELDAVITTGPPQVLSSHCQWHPLTSEPFYLVAPLEAKGQTLASLLRESDYIRFDRRAWAGTMIEGELQAQGLQLRETMEMDSLLAAFKMVEHGLGVTIMPLNQRELAEISRRFYLLPFGRESLYREVGLYQQRNHNRRQLTDFLVREFERYYQS